MEGAFVDFYAQFCLKFGHITFILPFVVIGMIFGKRDVCAKAACFLLWVMIFNTLLKYLFKVPLFPHLGSGYAFPSGHMHASAAFYGYIIYRTNNKLLKICLLGLLYSLGFSLIHCHFHDLIDVVGAIGFAVIELLIYHLLSTKFGDKMVGIIATTSAVATMIALNIIYKIEFHVWLAFYALIGTEIAMYLIPRNGLSSIQKKFLALVISSVVILITNHLFNLLDSCSHYLAEIKFALIPIIIASAMRLSERTKM